MAAGVVDCTCGENYMTQAEECSGCRERDDAEQRTNDAQPEVDALRVLADRVNRWFMFDNAPNLLAMREALDNVQRAQPRTDSPLPRSRPEGCDCWGSSTCATCDPEGIGTPTVGADDDWETKCRVAWSERDDARREVKALREKLQRTEPAVAYVAGDKLELARDGLWPGFKAGTKGTVTRLEDGIVHFHIDGHGGDYATSVNNVRPAGARRERASAPARGERFVEFRMETFSKWLAKELPRIHVNDHGRVTSEVESIATDAERIGYARGVEDGAKKERERFEAALRLYFDHAKGVPSSRAPKNGGSDA